MDASRLRALSEKYATLAAMRRREADGLPPRENAFYQALAARFPGALKELDRLPLDEIDRRRAELDLAAGGEVSVACWMTAVSAYHDALLELLHERRARRRGEAGAACSVVAVAAARASEAAGIPIEDVRSLLALKKRA